MAKESSPGAGLSLDDLMGAVSLSQVDGLSQAGDGALRRPLPPVESWNPPFCGDIDMRIARDGTWFYGGTPIGRPALVRLFASVLRKDPEGFRLVTPVEKVGLVVEDAPFIAVEMRRQGDVLAFRTNVDDWVEAGDAHPLRFEQGASGGLKPYLHVRGGLVALVARHLLYDLAEFGVEQETGAGPFFGVRSGGTFFPMAPMTDIEALIA